MQEMERTPERMSLLREMWIDGKSVDDIAKHMGVSTVTIYKWIKHAELPLRGHESRLTSLMPRGRPQKSTNAYLSRCAQQRGIPSRVLARRIMETVLRDHLIDAVLDDGIGTTSTDNVVPLGVPFVGAPAGS